MGNVPASKLRTDSTETVLSKARDLWNKGSRDDAVTRLEKWIEGNPDDLAVRLTLPNTYSNLKRFDGPMGDYETLLEVSVETLFDEARLTALNNLAWILCK